jgi:hypothetical protein
MYRFTPSVRYDASTAIPQQLTQHYQYYPWFYPYTYPAYPAQPTQPTHFFSRPQKCCEYISPEGKYYRNCRYRDEGPCPPTPPGSSLKFVREYDIQNCSSQECNVGP